MIFTFFILTTITAYGVSGAPSQIASIPYAFLDNYGDTASRNLSVYFQNFDTVNITWDYYGEGWAETNNIDVVNYTNYGSFEEWWSWYDYVNYTITKVDGDILFTLVSNVYDGSQAYCHMGLGEVTINVSDSSDNSSTSDTMQFRCGNTDTPVQIASIPAMSLMEDSTQTIFVDWWFSNFHALNLSIFYNGSYESVYYGYPSTSILEEILDENGNKITVTANTTSRPYFRYSDKYFQITNNGFKGNIYGRIDVYNTINGLSVGSIFPISLVGELVTNDTTNVNSPYQISSIADMDLGIDGNSYLYGNNIFANYDSISVSWEDDTLSQTVTDVAYVYDPSFCRSDGDFNYCSYPETSNIEFRFGSKGKNINKTIYLTASNSYGEVTTSFTLTSLNKTQAIDYDTEDYNDLDLISALNKAFTNLFPDSETLNTKQKIGFVIISIAILTLLIFLGTMKFMEAKMTFYVVMILSTLMILFFFSIGYIPISFLVIGTLLLLTIIFLKVKGG